ncbi:MAG: hypothetical protein AMJ78_10240 [Omnitrophica WOR_2 bacterium SM23_29]|nr:MAG: hypothetical protein AMJ78_10240 [Omnitrophica WOR_2 bacterium SM23_29]
MKIKVSGSKAVIGFIIFALFLSFSLNVEGQSPVSSQKITLDIKGMDIVDVLKILSQRTGMNIVASRNVTGRVTIFLKDVDVWDSFEIILLSNDLAYEVKGDIVSVMTGREYETIYGERFKDKKELSIIQLNYAKAVEIAKALNQVKTAVGRVVVDEGSNTLILMDTHDRLMQMEEMARVMDASTVTKVFALDYAKSDKLNAKIQDMVTKGVGSVRFDERTNKVVVTDLPEKVIEIEKVINAFDEKTRQVSIDAKIVQVELEDKFKSGIDWKAVFRRLTVEQTLTAGLTTGGKLTISTVFGDPNKTLDSVIDVLKETGKTDIISSPKVTAIDGEEAKILVGTKEAYITATTTTPATGAVTTAESVNFVDVGVQLYVTPTINKEGFVTMKIRPVVSSVSSRIETTASPDGVPIIKTSEAETSVVVKDGVTIVMGGLMEDKKVKSVNKFPILGDIPILGFPFRKTSEEVKKTELVIFLTPTVISGDLPGAIGSSEEDLIYTRYYDTIREKILDTAMRYYQQGYVSGEVAILFSIARNGSLRGEPKLLNEARPELADLAVRSLKASAPFPPLPKGLRGDVENFRITISYE